MTQTTHYYPYGGTLTHSANQGVQKFKYNSKEFDRTHGLDWYDYCARQYDPASGRFTSMDPLCEKYYNISPYSYCAGNPIRYVDPDGRDIYTLNKNGSLILDKICNGDDKISYGKQSFTIHHGAFGKTTKDQIGQDFSLRVANFKNVKEGLSFMRKVSEFTHKELNGIKLVDKRSNKTTRFQVGTWDKAHSYTSSDGHRHNAGNFRYERTENEKISLHIHTHTRFGTDGGSQNPSKLDLQLRNQADFQDCGLLIMTTSDGMLYNYNKMKNIKDTKNLELVNDERILQEYYK